MQGQNPMVTTDMQVEPKCQDEETMWEQNNYRQQSGNHLLKPNDTGMVEM